VYSAWEALWEDTDLFGDFSGDALAERLAPLLVTAVKAQAVRS
jgi:hypothetical protein